MNIVKIGNSYFYAKKSAPEVNYFWVTPKDEATVLNVGWEVIGSPAPIQLYYSFDKTAWTAYTFGNTISIASGQKLYFKGNDHAFSESNSNGYHFISPDGLVNIGGDLTTLLNKDGNVLDLTDYGVGSRIFAQMFRNCPDGARESYSNVYDAHELVLPSTTLQPYTYSNMFAGLAGAGIEQTIVNAGFTIPVVNVPEYAFNYMFNGAAQLTVPPVISSFRTIGARGCYRMFSSCYSLTSAPELTATTLASQCYAYMFASCTSLTTPPELPVTTLAGDCYTYMFRDCTSLVTLPELPATTLDTGCYNYMFRGCLKIKMSETQSDEYPNAYTFGAIPSATYAQNMFQGTGGSFTGAPTVQTLYTANTIV